MSGQVVKTGREVIALLQGLLDVAAEALDRIESQNPAVRLEDIPITRQDG